MFIGINNQDGLPIFAVDQFMIIPAVRDCYRYYGIHGVYYAILFGWEGSPYRGKPDLNERNTLAYMAIKDVELYDPVKDRRVRASQKIYKDNMYENNYIKQCINAINSLVRTPMLEQRTYYLTQIDELRAQQKKMILDPTDAMNFKRQVDTNKSINQSIKEMTNEIEKIDIALVERFKIDKYLSLDQLIMMA